MRIQAGSRATPRISALLLLAAVGCGARSELDSPGSATGTDAASHALSPQAVTVYSGCAGGSLQFFFTIWPRGSEVGCCSFASCHIASVGPGDIVVSGVPAYEAESAGTLTVGGPWGAYCLPLGGDMGGECVNVQGTLTLTEFSLATGVVSGSYSLVVVSTGMMLSDVISGTICPVAPGKCEGDPGSAGP